ncbi:MAG: DJ-1/PfpI family protein [Chloroflexi bacterium]|nr:DJ-1/PfpI family protein [Chloroflexota bacterium]MCY3937263.1 DJ-1/PfpI family protein [Chloroflexota bacterium]
MAKVLMVVGDGAEVFDTLYPIYRVREDGFECDVAAPEKGTYHMVLHEQPEDWDITQETAGYHIESDVAFRDINPTEYTGILISGGRAPEYIRYDEDLLRTVRYFVEAGLPVGSVCHGIEVLATAGVIEGKRVTTVKKCKFDAEICGGIYVDEPVVISDNVITARTWHDNAEWMREFMRQLNQARVEREKVA